jgi:hypothetical protein|tara:strand:- start:864 stop:1190 length:327 start_codon:yes stop_codon:yes gene_type:complete
MKVQIYKVGGFFRWMLSLTTRGSAGELTYTNEGISYKSAFMNFGGKFNCNLTDLTEIGQSRYINFLVFPNKCLVLLTANRKAFKFFFHSDNDKNDFFTFCRDNNIKTP